MLIVAIAYGSLTDPFTTSTTLTAEEAAKEGLDPDNANQMRNYIASEKGLMPDVIDEVLVIYPSDFDGEIQEPIVQHHHTEFD